MCHICDPGFKVEEKLADDGCFQVIVRGERSHLEDQEGLQVLAVRARGPLRPTGVVLWNRLVRQDQGLPQDEPLTGRSVNSSR